MHKVVRHPERSPLCDTPVVCFAQWDAQGTQSKFCDSKTAVRRDLAGCLLCGCCEDAAA